VDRRVAAPSHTRNTPSSAEIIEKTCTKIAERAHSPRILLPTISKSHMRDKMGPIIGNSRSSSSICPKATEAVRAATKPKTKINAPIIRIKKASGRDIPHHL
jgi:hypothetical protein